MASPACAIFFLAQVISVALYVIGFTEAFQNLFPDLGLSARAIGTIVNVGIFIYVYIGASWAIKVQFGILAILALGPFFAGAIPAATEATLRANLGSAYIRPGRAFSSCSRRRRRQAAQIYCRGRIAGVPRGRDRARPAQRGRMAGGMLRDRRHPIIRRLAY